MRRLKINPLARAIGVFGVVAALVTGATFALMGLNSTATAENNTLSTGTSGLLIRTTGDTFAPAVQGFTINNLVPGTGAEGNFSLRNSGSQGMEFEDISVDVPQVPPVPAGFSGYGFTGWENLTVRISSPGCQQTLNTNMALLLSDTEQILPCGGLGAGQTRNYTAHFDINPSSITPGSTQAGVGPFNLVFTGDQGNDNDSNNHGNNHNDNDDNDHQHDR